MLSNTNSANTITVRAPSNKDRSEIQRLVLNKASWILKKQKEYREKMREVEMKSNSLATR
jgi:predicted metal-dependent hydrolase